MKIEKKGKKHVVLELTVPEQCILLRMCRGFCASTVQESSAKTSVMEACM